MYGVDQRRAGAGQGQGHGAELLPALAVAAVAALLTFLPTAFWDWLGRRSRRVAVDGEREELVGVLVEVVAHLGRAMLPLTELMQLQAGDVIPLEGRTTNPVRVFVDNKEKFLAVPGRSGQQRALRIVNVAPVQNEEDDDA